MRRSSTIILLLFVSAIVFLFPLHYIEITSGHEAREGIRLRAMQTSGEWLFSEVLRKPPLYYWLSGLIAQLRGGAVDALTLRLPSGLLATIGVLLVSLAGRRLATSTGALWAGFLLLTSPLYVQQSYSSRTDMTLCFFVTASLLQFFLLSTHHQEQDRQGTWGVYLFFGALACAFLSKGPVGLILVVLPIIGFLLWRQDRQDQKDRTLLRAILRPGPLLLFGALCGGWYGGALWSAGDAFWRTQIMEENVSRFIGGLDRMSPLYYVGPLFGVFAPWSLFLPFALWRAVRNRRQEEGPFFLALWWIATVLFFQLAAYKRAHYLLPVLPPAALLVGWWLAVTLPTVSIQRQHWEPAKFFSPLLSGLSSLLLIMGALILCGAQGVGPLTCQAFPTLLPLGMQEYAPRYCSWLTDHFWLGLAWLGVLAACLFVMLWSLWRARNERAFIALLCALVLIYTALYPSWRIVAGWAASPRAYTQRLVEKLSDADSVAFISPYDEKGVAVLFALQDSKKLTDVRWPWEASQPRLPTGYYLVTEDRRKELISGAHGVWTEMLRDTSAIQWPITLFFYSAQE